MTLAKVIENFDNERKNSLPYGQKVNWLSQLDMKISSELLEPRGEGDFSGYTETTSPETVVRAPEEYCEIYGLYLNMSSITMRVINSLMISHFCVRLTAMITKNISANSNAIIPMANIF